MLQYQYEHLSFYEAKETKHYALGIWVSKEQKGRKKAHNKGLYLQ